MKHADYLQRVLFDDINVRCVWVSLEQVLDDILADSDYPPAVTRLLTESLLVVAMLSSGLKFRGRISLQLQARGALSLLMADCTESGGLRAIARLSEHAEIPGTAEQLLADVARGGNLSLTLDPVNGGQRWQGIVPLEGNGLADAVRAYFELSEQLPTRFCLAVDERQACGLMIQQMPGGDNDQDDDGWNRLEHLLATLGSREMLTNDGATLVRRLFHQEPHQVLEPSPLSFYCPCSRERVLDVLEGLGAEEIQAMIEEENTIEVRCQFCNRAYHFDPIDLATLGHDSSDDDAPPTVH
jgi:molecular chaperone Hsp33